MVGVQVIFLVLFFLLPLVALPLVTGWTRISAGVAVVIPILVEIGVALEFDAPPLYALTFPFGALIFEWMMVRSAIVTLRQGGIVWRGTFYPLEELKKGAV